MIERQVFSLIIAFLQQVKNVCDITKYGDLIMLLFYQNESLLQLSIMRSDYVQLTSRWRDPDAYLSMTRLYFVESGSGYLQTPDGIIPLEPGYVYLIPSYLHFGYGCSGLKKLYFHIRISSVEQKDLLSGIGRILKLPYEPELLQALLGCREGTELYGLLRLQMLLQQVICRFAEAYTLPQLPIKTYSETVTQAISYIQAAPSLKHTGKSIASHLFISESKLRNAFKKELDTTIGDYIDRCVFRQAKQLLQSRLSIEQISSQLGFCDQFYFSRRFKQRYGITPSQYRKRLLAERT